MHFRHFGRRYLICFTSPFLVLLLAYAAYNYSTIKRFTIISSERLEQKHKEKFKPKSGFTQYEESVLKQAVSTFPRYHPFYLSHNSWSLDSLHYAYRISRWGNTMYIDSQDLNVKLKIWYEYDEILNVDSLIMENKNQQPEFITFRNWYLQNRAVFVKIWNNYFIHYNRHHRPSRIKRLLSSFVSYNKSVARADHLFYYSELKHRFNDFFIEDVYKQPHIIEDRPIELMEYTMREFYGVRKSWDDYEKSYAMMTSDPVFKLYDIVNIKVIRKLVRTPLWIYVFWIIFILVSARLMIDLKKNPVDFFLLFIVASINIGSCLVFTFFSLPSSRYCLTTEFTFFLLPALSLALIDFKSLARKIGFQKTRNS